MDVIKFAKIADSLRQYRRAELRDFDVEMDTLPAIDSLYVDPLPSNVVLNHILSANTTFLLGRKGTGKSTIFAKAQSEIRKREKEISIYIDVKAIYDLVNTLDVPVQQIPNVSEEILHIHLVRKVFLSRVVIDLIKELTDSYNRLSLFDRWIGKKRQYQDILQKMESIKRDIDVGKTSASEIPVLKLISKKAKDQMRKTEQNNGSAGLEASLQQVGAEIKISNFDEILSDIELYEDYSDAILHTFPFDDILQQISDFLSEVGMSRLVVFFDDFSEINFVDQRLFVDVVLAPLNNSSNEIVKLKIAGYPGRIYYGKIDPSKVDTICLDFSALYKDKDIQMTERRAIDYTKRLLQQRFNSFHAEFFDYFDSKIPIEEYMRLIFECTFNVPRIMGFVLNYCYRDRISQNLLITPASLRLAAQKYYEEILLTYFERMYRFALEPFEQKLDRHIQQDLLMAIINEVKDVRRKIIAKEIGGDYFKVISNPPASHFSISRDFEPLMASLEFNFILSKYHEMRDKDGNDITIYALNYGLCETENIPWGYPTGRRDDRSYFVQRCFSYNKVLHEFLAKKQTIRCQNCGSTFSIDRKESFELYKWQCPDCKTGKCYVINLADDFRTEIEKLDKELMLETIELEILNTLNCESRPMRASDISMLIDESYQLIGKRTNKLRDLGYVDKKSINGTVLNKITDIANSIYFSKGQS